MATEQMVRRFHADGERHDRSIVDLLKELRDEMTELLRQEVALARTEVSDKVAQASRNIAYLAIGGLILYSGLLILLIAATAGTYAGLVAAGLSHYIAGWLAPLAVGLLIAAIGYALLQKAINTFKGESLTPKHTIRSVQETKQWVQEKVS